jgi:hypothetical protein
MKSPTSSYGIYDIAKDTGFVSLEIDRDTAQFSVAAIRAVVAATRTPALPRRLIAGDHRRLRRLQRQPHPLVEDRTAAPGRLE